MKTSSNSQGRITFLNSTNRLQGHLASPGLDHELSGQVWGRLRLQRSDHNTLVQRVTRYNLKTDKHNTSQCMVDLTLVNTASLSVGDFEYSEV